ncbi:hypothetical protein TNCV_4351071 [Trichonephila clavipes]|nr:hypothetical protein TNCV_4351071 [Trichonephila clavipes]
MHFKSVEDQSPPVCGHTVIPRLTLPRPTRIRSYAIFKSRRFVPPIIKSREEPLPESYEIGNLTEEVLDLARQINSVLDSDDV